MSEATVSRNPPLLVAFRSLQMALFPMAVLTVFLKTSLGFSIRDIMLLQAAFGGVMVLCEFPSGYVADRIGYRLTLMAGSVILCVGWMAYVFADSFLTLLGAEMVLGVGLAFLSGCDHALLFESLKEAGRSAEYVRWAGRASAMGQIAEGTAALTAGVLFVWWERMPFALEVLIFAMAFLVAAFMVEPKRHRPEAGKHWQQIKGMLRHVALDNPRLAAVFFLSVVLGLSSFVPVWLISIYAKDAGLPDAWLGALWAAANYMVAGFNLLSARALKRAGLTACLLICVGLVATGYIGLGLSHALFGFVFYYCLTAMRGLFGPLLSNEEQNLIPSSDRAGFVSLRSLLFRASFMVLGPLVGAAIDHWGMHPVLLALGLTFTLAAALGVTWLVQTERAPRLKG